MTTVRRAVPQSTSAGRRRSGPPVRAAVELALSHARPGAELLGSEDVWRGQVYRLHVRDGDVVTSAIAKRFRPQKGALERLVLTAWLPAEGLAWVSPRLLAVSGEVDDRVWHLYEDLGRRTLDQLHGEPLAESTRVERGFMTPLRSSPNAALVRAAMTTMAAVHRAFSGHRRLDEIARMGQPHGADFYRRSISRARTALEGAATALGRADPRLLDSLRGRLDRLRAEQTERTRHLAAVGGSETLLHGDFSIRNTLIVGEAEACEGRLIDWDRAGAGPISEDISVFLAQLPAGDRPAALATYREAVGEGAAAARSIDDWDRLFETAELARLASCIVGPAQLVAAEPTAWAVGSLRAVDEWFEGLRPLLAGQGPVR